MKLSNLWVVGEAEKIIDNINIVIERKDINFCDSKAERLFYQTCCYVSDDDLNNLIKLIDADIKTQITKVLTASRERIYAFIESLGVEVDTREDE